MSAMPIALLLTTAATGAVGVAVLRSIMVLRRQVTALRAELAESRATATRGRVPAARTTADAEEIRAAVAEALAEERERELAEARAFWAAQETRDASDAPLLLGLSDSELFLPRQADLVGLESVTEPVADTDEPLLALDAGHAGPRESAKLAAARRRHPSHPDFVPNPSPAVNDHDRTVATLSELAESSVALADVRPGPPGHPRRVRLRRRHHPVHDPGAPRDRGAPGRRAGRGSDAVPPRRLGDLRCLHADLRLR
ncbi:hypothetical protein STENM327S_03944 [Streptomyces tendae]